MRLINTTTLKPELFSNDNVVEYAILSHRWEDEEVSYQDMVSGNNDFKKGYDKIKRACGEAARAGLQYVWVDTCCIDKSSSAELSEAINSMYRWYQRAKVCYAYLSDVETISDLESSAWFTRGWTLQELVAPRNMKFYDKHWRSFGTKSGLQLRISTITKIPLLVLRECNPSACSVAQCMSWASDRLTTRPEDQAYCLMGLFDVNMPMLYGEGNKAFIRLQEEVIKISDDHSIFAWSDTSNGRKGILAPSPSCFRDCSDVISTAGSVEPEQYSMTNVGLSIRLLLMPWAMDIYIAVLQCRNRVTEKELMPGPRQLAQNLRTGILLKRTALAKQYFRVSLAGRNLFEVDPQLYAAELVMASILILQRINQADNPYKLYGMLFRNLTIGWFPSSMSGETNFRKVIARTEGTRMNWSNNIYKKEELDHMELRDMQSSVPVWVYEMPNGSQGMVVSFQWDGSRLWRDPTHSLGLDNVAVIDLGFDFDFNPVCIIHNFESERWRTVTDQRLDDCQTIKREVKRYKDSGVTDTWSADGVCVLVGDRINGMSARLPDLNLTIEIREDWLNAGVRAWLVDIGAIKLPSVYYERDPEVYEDRMGYDRGRA